VTIVVLCQTRSATFSIGTSIVIAHDRHEGVPKSPRCLDLPLEDGDLEAQNQDLSVLGAIGPGEQGEQGEHPQHRQVGESHRHGYRQCPTMRLPRSQMLNLTTLSPT
jgi:hypothetical protein